MQAEGDADQSIGFSAYDPKIGFGRSAASGWRHPRSSGVPCAPKLGLARRSSVFIKSLGRKSNLFHRFALSAHPPSTDLMTGESFTALVTYSVYP